MEVNKHAHRNVNSHGPIYIYIDIGPCEQCQERLLRKRRKRPLIVPLTMLSSVAGRSWRRFAHVTATGRGERGRGRGGQAVLGNTCMGLVL